MNFIRSTEHAQFVFRCTIVAVFLISHVGQAQTFTEVLETVRNTPYGDSSQASRSIFPWLSTIELRTESDEFELKRQSYQLRLTPNTPKISKTRENYISLLQEQNVENSKEGHVRQLKHTATEYLNNYYTLRKFGIEKDLLKAYEEELITYAGELTNVNLTSYDLLLLEQKIQEISAQIQMDSILISPSKTIARDIQIDGLIPVARIPSILDQLDSQLSTEQEPSIKQQLVESEIELEEATRKRTVDFLQFEYSGPHNQLLRERWSIGLALIFPIANNTWQKIRELRIEKQEVAEEAYTDFEDDVAKTKQKKQQLLKDIAIYNQNKVFVKKIAKTLDQGTSESILEAIQLSILLKEQTIGIQQKELQIYTDYLDLLEDHPAIDSPDTFLSQILTEQ